MGGDDADQLVGRALCQLAEREDAGGVELILVDLIDTGDAGQILGQRSVVDRADAAVRLSQLPGLFCPGAGVAARQRPGNLLQRFGVGAGKLIPGKDADLIETPLVETADAVDGGEVVRPVRKVLCNGWS